MKELNLTTWEFQLLENKFEVGDKNAVDFKPTVELFNWGEECSLKVSVPTTKSLLPIKEEEKLKWVDGNMTTKVYPLEKQNIVLTTDLGYHKTEERYEKGGVEIEAILTQKPETNKIIYNITTKGLRFTYQPPLTPLEKKTCYRPEDVIGSYAVYNTFSFQEELRVVDK